MADDPYLADADSRVEMTSFLLLKQLCACEGICDCGWDD